MKSSLIRSSMALAAIAILTTTTQLQAKDWPQWRGPNRDGISSETGLLKQWPATGPTLAWKITDSGNGYSTPAIAGDRLFLLGNEGLENEFVAALSPKDGKKLWQTRLGNVGAPKQQPSFPAARSTPTVDGNLLYALGSDGDLACVETATGKIRWQKNLVKDFGGKFGNWAYSESPLIDGDTLVCTPGGAQATIVALNKKTGDVIWKSPTPEADDAAYSSAIFVTAAGVKQYVQLLTKGLVGVDAKTGRLLWRYSKAVSKYGANIPTPTAHGDIVYAGTAGTGGGAVKLVMKDGKFEPQELYFEAKLPTAIGGTVRVGDYIYGASGQSLLCAEFATGKIKWEERSIGASSIVVADGVLFLHGENGEVALVAANPEAYKELGRFTPPDAPKHSNPMEKSWAYPVVANGKLYVRDHGNLWCYNVK